VIKIQWKYLNSRTDVGGPTFLLVGRMERPNKRSAFNKKDCLVT